MTMFAHTASGWGYWTDLQTLPAVARLDAGGRRDAPIPAGVDAIAWGVSICRQRNAHDRRLLDHEEGRLPAARRRPGHAGRMDRRWATTMPIRAIHATVLKNGKVLLIAGSGNNLANFNAGSFKAAVWDPVTGVLHDARRPEGHVLRRPRHASRRARPDPGRDEVLSRPRRREPTTAA